MASGMISKENTLQEKLLTVTTDAQSSASLDIDSSKYIVVGHTGQVCMDEYTTQNGIYSAFFTTTGGTLMPSREITVRVFYINR